MFGARGCRMHEKYDIFLFLLLFQLCYCDWVSEWLTPIRDQYKVPSRRMNNMGRVLDEDKLKMFPIGPEVLEIPKNNMLLQATSNVSFVNMVQSRNLRITLETILGNAQKLADSLKAQILIVQEREERLKENIANGRLGITTLTVSTLRKLPKNYIIRDGDWTLCNGVVQHPSASKDDPATMFSELYAVPRCIGQEVISKPDPCVFHSVIKYDTIPSQRKPEYSEEEYLCLKPTFNTTLEQYYSVTKRVVNQTCKNGVVRSLADNVLECGQRVLSDYTYYPNRQMATSYLPLEYCEGFQGSCKLIVAWHLSNASVENFEFIKDDMNFKNYFMKSSTFLNNALY